MTGRHTAPGSPGIRRTIGAGVLVTTVGLTAIGAGVASADPSQGGITPNNNAPSAPSQGGITPAPAPGPGVVPAPPADQGPYRQMPNYLAPGYSGNSGDGNDNSQPSYNGPGYNGPSVQKPIGPPSAAPVRPIAPPPGDVRIGLFVEKKPDWLPQPVANSINAYAAYSEAKISQAWRAGGAPPEDADRRAAAEVMGVVGGGALGATVAGVPAALVGGGVGAVAGALIGGTVTGGSPVGIGGGAAIGAGVGATVLGVPAALAGGTAGAVIGGVAGWALGAGDDKADPNRVPWAPTSPSQPAPAAPAPSGPNQYELHLPAHAAQQAGLPPVDYVVRSNGDVSANVGGHQGGWSSQQANGAYTALGQAGTNLKRNVDRGVVDAGNRATQLINGLHIAYPGQHPAPAHR